VWDRRPRLSFAIPAAFFSNLLDQIPNLDPRRSAELIALDDALNSLAALDARKARVIELRFFGGLTVDETAAILQVSPQTVLRDWKLAKAWLLRELKGRPELDE
jgi:RNA polymerase sigma-70 factor, ECF subfamily